MLAGGGSGLVSSTSVMVRVGQRLRVDSRQDGNRFIFRVFSLTGDNETLLLNSTSGNDGLGYYNETGPVT